jgi:hypothetical protein
MTAPRLSPGASAPPSELEYQEHGQAGQRQREKQVFHSLHPSRATNSRLIWVYGGSDDDRP